MEVLQKMLVDLKHWGNLLLFKLGDTDITLFRIVGLFLILFLAWWFSIQVEHAIQKSDSSRFSSSGKYALSRIMRYTVWILGTLIGLTWLGFDMQSLAILGGALGVGIGFGLQNIFSNFISGIILLVEKTLKVGDFVDLQSGVVGTVTEISMRYTRVTTNDSVDIVVPNSEFINGRVTNWTFDETARRIHIPFGVAYGSDKEKVREAGIAAANSVEGTISDGKRVPDVWLVNFGESSLDFELVIWVEKIRVISPGRTNALYLWALETELRNRGIEIPFPQRDLHIRSGRLPVVLEPKQE
jgi:small-conductance mechanosensitive channel